MEESRINPMIWWGVGIAIVGTVIILMFKGCSAPVANPAVDRLHTINDSLYNIIKSNNEIADSLFRKIDSLDFSADTIINHQDITNKYYTNETYTILNSNATDANKQYRTTLKKSDSLLKSGFYSRTYDLRSAAFRSQLQ
jgi:hypothetical protein